MCVLPEYEELALALEPFGIDNREVLDIWRDRARFGGEPATDEALERLSNVITRLRIARAAA